MDKDVMFDTVGSLIRKNPRVVYKGFEREADATKYMQELTKKQIIDVKLIVSPNNKKWYVIYSW